ncbi:presqualene diphosphate synthase HpnD [Nitrospirales bacterium NOB]|nr:All-trans-phytoene synthase [Nitrospirota bacterium]MCE7965927.1 squalene synthase HpnD [Nitrospira sp. NTP2]MDL1889165.1 presqualene diphosphate synthase HpnD [Nitrospirales bacterium NOB]MEB2339554.1 presqualene diphosphate synthase HpnD [Nitrospirales bacterium]QOJ36534.1 MAG: presqualene diphosphate synthase HpnD [Nitrospira sp.]
MTPAQAQAYCTNLTKKSGSNFYYSFLFLPKARREAMYTVYAFCKAVDSAVDEPPPGSHPQEELARWRRELDAAYQGTPSLPVTISLAHHARSLGIPRVYFEELIKGVEMDLSTKRYETFEALSLYCYRVASVVGLICLHVFGTTSPRAQDYAVNLGMAFQLTNILRDLGGDAECGRVYLPQEDLARFKYREEDLLQRRYAPEFTELMKFEVGRAKDFYAKAARALSSLPASERRALTVAEIMRGVYSRILRRIEESNYQVLGDRIRLSPSHRLAVAAGVWLQSRLPSSTS